MARHAWATFRSGNGLSESLLTTALCICQESPGSLPFGLEHGESRNQAHSCSGSVCVCAGMLNLEACFHSCTGSCQAANALTAMHGPLQGDGVLGPSASGSDAWAQVSNLRCRSRQALGIRALTPGLTAGVKQLMLMQGSFCNWTWRPSTGRAARLLREH